MLWTIEHASKEPLQAQIAGCVRRGIADGTLRAGEQLPPAAELAIALSVDRNTVLAAYRQLRDSGALEFRRGRGARVAESAVPNTTVDSAAREFVEIARSHGYRRADLVRLIEELL